MYDSFAINVAAHFLVYGGKYEAQASKMKPSHLLHTLLSGLCFAIHNLILKKYRVRMVLGRLPFY